MNINKQIMNTNKQIMNKKIMSKGFFKKLRSKIGTKKPVVKKVVLMISIAALLSQLAPGAKAVEVDPILLKIIFKRIRERSTELLATSTLIEMTPSILSPHPAIVRRLMPQIVKIIIECKGYY